MSGLCVLAKCILDVSYILIWGSTTTGIEAMSLESGGGGSFTG